MRKLAFEVPKRHDVGPVLREAEAALPKGLRSALPWILELSAALAERRALAMYGDELAGRGASELFASGEEAGRFLEQSRHLNELVAREQRPTREGTPSRRRRRGRTSMSRPSRR